MTFRWGIRRKRLIGWEEVVIGSLPCSDAQVSAFTGWLKSLGFVDGSATGKWICFVEWE